jgi:hypothetical protein
MILINLIHDPSQMKSLILMIMTHLKFGTWFSSWPISNQVMISNKWSWPIWNFWEKCKRAHTHTHTHPPKWVLLLSISWPHVIIYKPSQSIKDNECKHVGWWWVYPWPKPMTIDNPIRVSGLLWVGTKLTYLLVHLLMDYMLVGYLLADHLLANHLLANHLLW